MKKAIALFLALMLTLSLCACSQEKDSEGAMAGISSSEALLRPQRSGIAGLVDRFFDLFR